MQSRPHVFPNVCEQLDEELVQPLSISLFRKATGPVRVVPPAFRRVGERLAAIGEYRELHLQVFKHANHSYSHVLPALEREAAEKMEAVLSSAHGAS